MSGLSYCYFVFSDLNIIILIHLPNLVNLLTWFQLPQLPRMGPDPIMVMAPIGFRGRNCTVCDEVIINWLVSTSPC